MKWLEVIKSRTFLLHTGLMLVTTFILIWLGFKFLEIYTRHGSSYVVPDFSGMTMEAIAESNDYKTFRVDVFDSIYDNSRPGGVVVDQDPPAGMEVKRKRTVHLTVVSKTQELVSLPDLGNTVRSAKAQLEAYGLVAGKVTEVNGEYPGLLMGAYYMGRPVEEGVKLLKGARIDLEVAAKLDFSEMEEEMEEEF